MCSGMGAGLCGSGCGRPSMRLQGSDGEVVVPDELVSSGIGFVAGPFA